MARFNPKAAVVRVEAGGGFAEWFDVYPRMTVGMRLARDEQQTAADRAAVVLSLAIRDWSLTDEQGEKLPITADVCKGLDEDLIAPVWGVLSTGFLAQGERSQPTSQSVSPDGSTALTAN